MKGVIIYKGRYGATRQYSEWLKEELNLPIVDPNDCEKELSSANLLVLGSSVYIGKLELTNWFHAYADLIKVKRIILFIVCATPAHEKEKLESYIKASVPEEIRKQCQFYFLPGRLVRKELSLKDKFLLWMGALLSKDPNVKKAMHTDYDAVKRENLDDLIRKIELTDEKVEILQPG